LAGAVGGAHAGELRGGVAQHDVGRPAERVEKSSRDAGFREIALDYDHVRKIREGLDRGHVEADHPPARTDQLRRDLHPAARPGAPVGAPLARAQHPVRALELLQLVGRARAEPLPLGAAVEGVLALVQGGSGAGRLRGGYLRGATAARTRTRPSFGPGTAPRTSRRLRSASTRATTRLRVVTCWLPMRPGMRRPLIT